MERPPGGLLLSEVTVGSWDLRVFVLHPGITPLGNDPEWFKIAQFYPDMCLNEVNTQWVYSQGVLQKTLRWEVQTTHCSYSLASVVSNPLEQAFWAHLSKGYVKGSVAQSRPFDLLVSPFWSIFSGGVQRLTLYFWVLASEKGYVPGTPHARSHGEGTAAAEAAAQLHFLFAKADLVPRESDRIRLIAKTSRALQDGPFREV